jgi:Fe-S oxidoreductase
VLATNPTCSQMLRIEYPRLLDTDAARQVAAHTKDPLEYLAGLHRVGQLDREFRSTAGKIAYHMPCHLRAQNIGYATRDVLALLPDTQVELIEACSGHDGTWAMKTEHFPDSLRWGRNLFQQIERCDGDVTCSDCPLAGIQIHQGTGKQTLNPIQILARSYRGEPVQPHQPPTKPTP